MAIIIATIIRHLHALTVFTKRASKSPDTCKEFMILSIGGLPSKQEVRSNLFLS